LARGKGAGVDLRQMSEDLEEQIRRESIGAFVHELRTPLTSMRMVLELGRRASSEAGEVHLDRDLAEMLDGALLDLQKLADALQETSWLERGRIKFSTGPTNLAVILDAVRAETSERLRIAVEGDAQVSGPWDETRLTSALVGMSEATNRCGKGDGSVHIAISHRAERCDLVFSAGTLEGNDKALNADLGFPFFRGFVQLQKMGAEIDVDRRDRAIRIDVGLPL
jgi:signal transduction histidine kinase